MNSCAKFRNFIIKFHIDMNRIYKNAVLNDFSTSGYEYVKKERPTFSNPTQITKEIQSRAVNIKL